MLHYMLDGFLGARARLDDIRLVHEAIEQIPVDLGLMPVMPPFLLPYFTGAEPDDIGISAFVFLAGGHLTIHTFSVRACYFVDLVYPEPFDIEKATKLFQRELPCDAVFQAKCERFAGKLQDQPYDPDADFGPHLLLDIAGYEGSTDLETIFDVFETLPERLGMTPIMRPYVIKGRSHRGRPVVSAMTMIAESHVALHVFPEEGRGYFDIFSCRPFDRETVVGELLQVFRGENVEVALQPRGRAYVRLRSSREAANLRAGHWLSTIRRS